MFPSAPRTLLRASALPRAAVLARPAALGESNFIDPHLRPLGLGTPPNAHTLWIRNANSF
jgi:hypothetical protein